MTPPMTKHPAARRSIRTSPSARTVMFARPSARRPSRRRAPRLSVAMTRRFRATRTGRRFVRRAGVTLTEVLMSLMVMGIGVTSVATLFPLAVLRGARATQLTAGTILKENAEETVRFSNSAGLEAPLPASIGGVPTSIVAAFPKGTSPGVDGLAMLRDPDANGNVNVCGPNSLVSDANTLAWGPGGAYRGNGGTPRKYVVDPLGAATLAGDGNPLTSPWFFGAGASATSAGTNSLTGAPLVGDPTLRFAWPYPWEMVNAANNPANAGLRRQMVETAYNVVGRAGDYGAEADVDAVITRRKGAGTDPDYLEVLFDAKDVEAGSLEEFFPQNGTDAPPAGAGTARAVVFAPDQKTTAAIPLARYRTHAAVDVVPANGRIIKLALPRSGFLTSTGMTAKDAVGTLRVRLERPDRRYSWMLTCRRTGTGREEAEVAVFFNRALSAEDESVWRCERSATGSYVLFWDEGAGQRNPLVSGGSWLLEVGELSWLQVGRVLETGGDPRAAASPPAHIERLYTALGSTLGTPRYLEFLLSSETPRRNEAGASGPLFATFPRGVVSVYTLDP